MQLTHEQLVNLHATLKALIKQAEQPRPPLKQGICGEWADKQRYNTPEWHACFDLINALGTRHWPEGKTLGGSVAYPIPWPSGPSPKRWEGEQLRLRLSLMRYVLKRLRDWIRRGKGINPSSINP